MKCLCRSCQLSRRIKRTCKNGSHQQKNKLILELSSDLAHTGADLNYLEVIMDGSWPSAVEILTRALENAKLKAAERGEDL